MDVERTARRLRGSIVRPTAYVLVSSKLPGSVRRGIAAIIETECEADELVRVLRQALPTSVCIEVSTDVPFVVNCTFYAFDTPEAVSHRFHEAWMRRERAPTHVEIAASVHPRDHAAMVERLRAEHPHLHIVGEETPEGALRVVANVAARL